MSTNETPTVDVTVPTDDLIEVVDAAGTVGMVSNEPISVSLTGPASLAGLGSAHPAPPGPYTDADDVTWQGRALAVIRASRDAGPATLTVTSSRFGTASTGWIVDAR